MAYLHNIKKLPNKKYYVGYAHGVWHINKSNSSFGNWRAIHTTDPRAPTLYAFTLKEMSKKLDGYRPLTRNPVIKKGKLKSGKPYKVYAPGTAPKAKKSFKRFKKAVRLVKRNPSKRAYAITGMDRYGNKWYFTGTGFDRSRKLILTFPSKASAEYRMGEIVNQLPHQIDTITLADA